MNSYWVLKHIIYVVYLIATHNEFPPIFSGQAQLMDSITIQFDRADHPFCKHICVNWFASGRTSVFQTVMMHPARSPMLGLIVCLATQIGGMFLCGQLRYWCLHVWNRKKMYILLFLLSRQSNAQKNFLRQFQFNPSKNGKHLEIFRSSRT